MSYRLIAVFWLMKKLTVAATIKLTKTMMALSNEIRVRKDETMPLILLDDGATIDSQPYPSYRQIISLI